MKYKLSLILEPQPEGGFTVTCEELPELITEGDSIGEAVENAIDAFFAVRELYQQRKRKFPRGVEKSTIRKQYKSSTLPVPPVQFETAFSFPYYEV